MKVTLGETQCHLVLLFVFYLSSNYVLILKIFEVSLNFALDFQLKYQVDETFLQCQDFFFRLVAPLGLGEFQPIHINFQKKGDFKKIF